MGQPSNLKFVGRWKLLIHVCNTWTTITCFWANANQNKSKGLHFAMLFSGWAVIQMIIIGYEVRLFNSDVFKKEIGDQANISAVKAEIAKLRSQIVNSSFVNRWGSHFRIVRLLRLAEHPDLEIQRIAFEALAILTHQDQMTEAYSFFAMLCPTDPAVFTLMDAIEKHPDDEIRNYATRIFGALLQMNAGNRYGLLVTFHSKLQLVDDQKGNMVAQNLVKYALEKADRWHVWHQIDAVNMLLEMGNTDSNDLPAVANYALPLLAGWIENGNVVQQYIAVQLAMKTANRFDLAGKVLHSEVLKNMLSLFNVIHEQYNEFAVDAEQFPDKFKGEPADGWRDAATLTEKMQPTFKCPAWSLPTKFKKMFAIDEITGDGAGDNWGVIQEATLTTSHLLTMQDDILVMCIQTVVDLCFAASAGGRKQILDAGGLDVLIHCLNFRSEKNLKSSGENSIHNRLQFEAFRAANGFLSGTFGEEEIEIDTDFKLFHTGLTDFKEGTEEEVTLSGLTPVQRRKAHIIGEYLGLNHESEGTAALRDVKFWHKPTSGFTNPMNDDDEDEDEGRAASPKGQDGDLQSWGFGGEEDAETKLIYTENWKRVSDTGIAGILLNGLAKNFTKLTSVDVQFQVLDVILQLVEHALITDEELPAVRGLMLTALNMGDRGLSVMGAKGMEVIVVRDGLYIPYGTRQRSEHYGKGPRLLKWCFKMTYWCIFWKMHSGTMGKMFATDELL